MSRKRVDHYKNLTMQYTEIFLALLNEKSLFWVKNKIKQIWYTHVILSFSV